MDGIQADHGLEEAARAIITQTFSCSSDVAEAVMRRGRLCSFEEQATIVRQGDWLALAYFLLLGRARALLYSVEGQIVLLHDYGPGDIIGALAEKDPVFQDADVVAQDMVRALSVESSEMALLAQQHGCIGLALSSILLRRLRQTTARMFERAALSAVGRVYAELLREARRAPDLRISPAPVFSELALRVSTTRETASRAVNALERRGIIRRDPTSLTVVAPRALEELII